MKKAFFKSDYPLGYRMSNGSQDLAFANNYAENYYALALAVFENYPSGKALYAMGIAPDAERSYEIIDCPYKQIAYAAYALHHICGIQQKSLVDVFGTSKTTLRKAINFAREHYNVTNPKTVVPNQAILVG